MRGYAILTIGYNIFVLEGLKDEELPDILFNYFIKSEKKKILDKLDEDWGKGREVTKSL